MKKVLSSLLWLFYIAIILYVLFAVLNVNTLENCFTVLVFEIIGFIALGYFIFCNMFSYSLKIGYLVPLLIVTVIYTIVLDVVNITFAASLGHVWFVLSNLVLLFVYCLISVPMYLMGRK